MLAPVALVLFGLALVAIVASSGPLTGEERQGEPSAAAQTTNTAAASSSDSGRRTSRRRRSYTVRAGDTLGAIAEKTSVPVEELQRLNPDLDPQALGAGEKLKLR